MVQETAVVQFPGTNFPRCLCGTCGRFIPGRYHDATGSRGCGACVGAARGVGSGGWESGGGNRHPPVPTAGRPRYPLAVQMPPLHAVGASSKALKEVAALVEFSLATQFLARVTFYFCSELSSSSV